MVETVVTVERTTTTQTPSPTTGGGLSAIRLNVGYFQTVPGIIKLVQLFLGIICMTCAAPAFIFATSFFLSVAIPACMVTIIWIFVYLLSIREALNLAINWILTFLGVICLWLASPPYIGASSFFLFVAIPSFMATMLWTFAYLLSVREALNIAINWIFTELLNTAVFALFYFIAFVVQLANWSSHPYFNGYGRNIAAGIFGLFNFIAYAVGTYFLFLAHRTGATI